MAMKFLITKGIARCHRGTTDGLECRSCHKAVKKGCVGNRTVLQPFPKEKNIKYTTGIRTFTESRMYLKLTL